MKRGSIILIPFYFTDFKGFKLRPSLIVSLNQSNRNEFIVAFISTIIPSKEPLHETHFVIDKKEPYFQQTGLYTTSIVKCDKLITIHRSIIEGLLGEMPDTVLEVIDNKLKIALSLR